LGKSGGRFCKFDRFDLLFRHLSQPFTLSEERS
jgi:hypothetical protein